jgi:hypothetical protein
MDRSTVGSAANSSMTDKIAKSLTDNKPLGRIVGFPDKWRFAVNRSEQALVRRPPEPLKNCPGG